MVLFIGNPKFFFEPYRIKGMQPKLTLFCWHQWELSHLLFHLSFDLFFFFAQRLKTRHFFFEFLHVTVLKPTSVCLVAQSCPTLVTPWIIVRQAPLSMGFFRQEYWVAISFSRWSFRPRDWTHVSFIAVRLFTDWARRETNKIGSIKENCKF